MVKLGQSSFRRILLSRILLLSVPVLLVGEYVTYRKARSMLLETARQNLTESAVRKAETIEQWAKSLKSNLIGASENSILQSVEPKDYQKFISQLGQRLPAQVDCLQLTNLQTNQVVASTCGPQQIHSLPAKFWPAKQQQLLVDDKSIYMSLLWPPRQQGKPNGKGVVLQSAEFPDPSKQSQDTQVSLVLSAPVYIRRGNSRQLTYALSLQSALPVQTSAPKGSLAGYTVAIDQDGTILAHPNIDRVGRNIDAEADADRLKSILRRAIAGGQAAFLHLFSFERNGVELLAGYAAIPSPMTKQDNSKWIILAVSRLDYALSGLEEIQQVLFNLIVGLIAASIIATLYLSRDLARPLEKLRDYALKVDTEAPQALPQNFQIREFNQLAEALDSMVQRLRSRAGELEVATKEAQVANQLKDEFLRNISHELRTPLNGMISFLQLVRDGYCDDRDEEMEFLQQAHDSAIHLLNIINDILDIAKIEAGSFSLMLEVVNLTEVLEEAVDLQAVQQATQIETKGLKLSLPTLRDPIAVYADPEKLKQVFLNVLSNAVKFTESGSITVSTRLESRKIKNSDVFNPNASESATSYSGESDWVVVTVKDTGIGIAPDQQQKLFQPFVMADGSMTRKFGGNGLGLAISRRIMESMRGSITLHSAGVNQGTAVMICLPVEQQSNYDFNNQKLVMENGKWEG